MTREDIRQVGDNNTNEILGASDIAGVGNKYNKRIIFCPARDEDKSYIYLKKIKNKNWLRNQRRERTPSAEHVLAITSSEVK